MERTMTDLEGRGRHQASSSATIDQLTQSALLALGRGDPNAARRDMQAAIEMGGALWFMLAQAEHLAGDVVAEEAALARHLLAEPRHLPALLMMGGIKARQGDDRAAVSFYRTALAVANQPGAVTAQELRPLLQRGADFIQAAQARFAAHLEQTVADAGLGDGQGGKRLRYAIDLLLGRAELYPQNPSMFYFPGLAPRQFFEREEFDWTDALEQATPVIRNELVAIMEGDGAFSPYVQSSPDRPLPNNPLRDDPSWGAYYLWRNGGPVSAAGAQCPATMKALEAVPMPITAGRSPNALFSLLKAGTHIQPHNGMLNTRLICHLPLIVPPGCALRVGHEIRQWVEGEILLFDDSIEHEAWNRSSRDRVVLLFEVWRPELSSEEQGALTRIFESIEAYAGSSVDQG
jgi:aspartyl/asparaginyl beta-hydroxylase (cupin superfamily)